MLASKIVTLFGVLLTASFPALAAAAHAVPSSPDPEVVAEALDAPEPVDINRATAEQLEEIPGVGPTLARRIVEFREEFGPFETVDDLLNVRGIGAKSLEKIRPYVKVSDEEEGGSDDPR